MGRKMDSNGLASREAGVSAPRGRVFRGWRDSSGRTAVAGGTPPKAMGRAGVDGWFSRGGHDFRRASGDP